MPAWLIPMVYLIASVIAALAIPRVEHAWFPAYGDSMSVASAQTLLGAVSSGMMAFTAIVFSIGFLFVQFTATAYSKRLLVLAARGSLVYHAFGFFISTFVFALGTLAFVDRTASSWVPVGSIAVVGALLALSIAMMAMLLNQVASLRVTRVLAFVGDMGRALIAQMPRTHAVEGQLPAQPPSEPAQDVRYSGKLMVLAAVDKPALVELARNAAGTIRLEYAVGDSIFEGSILARVYGARRSFSETAILGALRLAGENCFDTDVRFALRLLVDTAIMALSPAVNDPTTAVEALDQILDLMLRLARVGPETGSIADDTGVVRLIYPAPTWDDYLSLAFDEIRRYGLSSFQVVRRLRAALFRLEDALDGERRESVRAYRCRLDAGVEGCSLDPTDRATALGIDPQGLGLTRCAT